MPHKIVEPTSVFLLLLYPLSCGTQASICIKPHEECVKISRPGPFPQTWVPQVARSSSSVTTQVIVMQYTADAAVHHSYLPLFFMKNTQIVLRVSSSYQAYKLSISVLNSPSFPSVTTRMRMFSYLWVIFDPMF